MNVKLANVISDIVGERDGHILANLKSNRIRASKDEIEKSLVGNWREERLIALKQAMLLYDAYSERFNEYDRQLETMLAALQVHKVVIRKKKASLQCQELSQV